jgi:hypothetical protein
VAKRSDEEIYAQAHAAALADGCSEQEAAEVAAECVQAYREGQAVGYAEGFVRGVAARLEEED